MLKFLQEPRNIFERFLQQQIKINKNNLNKTQKFTTAK